MKAAESGKSAAALKFLYELSDNQTREWFQAHKADYETQVLHRWRVSWKIFVESFAEVSAPLLNFGLESDGILTYSHRMPSDELLAVISAALNPWRSEVTVDLDLEREPGEL